MTEVTLKPASQTQKPRLTWRERLRQNPVMLKEVRGRMRGRRAFVSLTIYLVLLSGFVSLVYFASAAVTSAFGSPDDWPRLGKAVFAAVVGLELFMLCFIAPGVTAGAISSEREQQTFDVLRATLLPARSLVVGKLASALSYLFLLLLAAVPIQSLAFLFGGVTPEEVIIGSAMLVVTALTFSAVGLFCSSWMKRTQASTVLAYVLALLLAIGLPLVVLILTPLLTRSFFVSSPGPADVSLTIAIYWLLLSISPLPAAIMTETALTTGQSVLSYNMPTAGGNTIQLIAPWIIYIAVYILLSAALVWLSIRNVERPEK